MAETKVNETTPEKTTLDSDTTKPSVTAPGDGPADTTDATEIASTVVPNPGDEAFTVGTVNAVKKVGKTTDPKPGVKKAKDRYEEYDAIKPDGSVVRVKRNIETGVSEIVSK